jgi:hypothetical protein
MIDYCARKQIENGKTVRDFQMGDQDALVITQLGVAGEIAFCKLMNIYPETDPTAIRKHDCVIDEWLVDVKTTPYANGKLLAHMKKKVTDVDIYVLMSGKWPHYVFCGWAWSKNLIHPSKVRDLGHGKTYMMEQDELNRELPCNPS